ncbi:hypothetical protein V8E55_006533 [Tylopilus felleus]
MDIQNNFMTTNIKAMYASSFTKDYEGREREAAIRAILRFCAHKDETHHLTKTKDGLHPAYILFNPDDEDGERLSVNKSELVEASLRDVFNGITMQDRLDGSLSLLIRCPGFETPKDGEINTNLVTVDLYITPRELSGNQRVNGDTALLVHAFCQDFAIPHLRRFAQRCQIESVKPPNPHPFVAHVSFTGPDHLPLNNDIACSHIQCNGLTPNAQPGTTQLFSSSAAIQEAATLHARTLNDMQEPSTPTTRREPGTPFNCSIRKRRLADQFVVSAKENLLGLLLLVIPDMTAMRGPPLTSLGANTDAVIDHFDLGDKLLPRLQVFIRTVHSSHWEAVLRVAPWNLTYEQASHLARVLAMDLSATVITPVATFTVCLLQKSTMFHVVTQIVGIVLQVIGLAALLFAIYVLVVYLLGKRGSWHVQPQPRARTKRKATEEYRSDLSATIQSVNECIQGIAATHHKSIRHVQNNLCFGYLKFSSRRNQPNAWNTFCWSKDCEHSTGGRACLPDIVKENLAEYCMLTEDAKKKIVEDFADFRITKTVGTCISAQSKINDVTHTLKAVENELDNLKNHIGVETLLFATRSTADLPLQGVAYSTDGVTDFMASVMGRDTATVVGQMEAYAVGGIKGSAQNHASRVTEVRNQIWEMITFNLREITGDPKAQMHWSQYFHNVIVWYHVEIRGWPESIPFGNLSSTCGSIVQLEMLL